MRRTEQVADIIELTITEIRKKQKNIPIFNTKRIKEQKRLRQKQELTEEEQESLKILTDYKDQKKRDITYTRKSNNELITNICISNSINEDRIREIAEWDERGQQAL